MLPLSLWTGEVARPEQSDQKEDFIVRSETTQETESLPHLKHEVHCRGQSWLKMLRRQTGFWVEKGHLDGATEVDVCLLPLVKFK